MVLSKRNVELYEKNKKYKQLKKKLEKIENSKKDKKVSFVLDNMDQESLVDSIFSSGDNFNTGEEQSFALFSEEEM